MDKSDPMQIDSSYVPHIPAGLIQRERQGLCLIVHPQRPRWLVTNRLGKEVIELCDGQRDVAEICRVLGRRYVMRPEEIEIDVKAFLENLDGAGLMPEAHPARKPARDPVGLTGVFLHITDRCNLRCVHCYVGESTKKAPDPAVDMINGLINDLAGIGGRSITLSGGEPLMRRDWPEIVEHAAESLRVTINTNGTLIDPDVAAQLARVRPYIQVSLDGPDADTHDSIRGNGTFAAALRGIRTLVEAGLADNLILSTTLMNKNIQRAREMIDLAVSLHIPKIRFLPLHRQGRARTSRAALDASREDYFRWFRHVYLEREAGAGPVEVFGGLIGFALHMPDEPDEHWCSIGRTVVIDSAGDVHPCALLMAPRFTFGNIHDMNLKQIESSPRLRGLTRACLARSEVIEKCRDCMWRSFCRASCPAFPFLEKGTFRATDEFCDFRRQLYEDAVFNIARRRMRRGQDSKKRA